MLKWTILLLIAISIISYSFFFHSDYQYLLFEATNSEETVDGKFPLIVFLHGAGERGTDLSLVEVHGPPKMVKTQKDFPFYVLSPQCPKGEYWDGKKVNHLVREILDAHPIDLDRVYLTGLSMGGFGTWSAGMRAPELYAAMAPICGGNESQEKRMANIKDIPIWAFHGDADEVVPISGTEALVAKAKAVGADIRYTRYPGVGHDSWTQTYENPELFKWMLKIRKKR